MIGNRNNLTFLRSYDYIFDLYKVLNREEPEPDHVKEITSCVIQSIEYFRSACTAEINVKPLLLYYGSLAISRALIMLIDKKRECDLHSGHGLSTKNWQEILSQKTNNILDLKLSVAKGTFLELLKATKNKIYF